MSSDQIPLAWLQFMTRSRHETKTLKSFYPAIILEIYILRKFYPNISCLIFQHRILYIVQKVSCLFVVSHICYAVTDRREFTRQTLFV